MKQISTIIFLLAIVSICNAQISKKDAKALNQKGENYIHTQYYKEAYSIFTDLTTSFPEDKNYRYYLAICETHTQDNLDKGLKTLIDLGQTYKEEDFRDYAFHIAHAYYYSHNHDKAKVYFDKYKEHIKNSGRDFLIDYVDAQAMYNENAITLYHGYDSTAINVSNLKKPINSLYNEYCPFVTPDESAIYFTYTGEKSTGGKQGPTHKIDEKNGKYYEDIFVSYRSDDGSWGDPVNLKTINSIENEACIGISHTGDFIFIFKSNKVDNGDIYYAKKNGNEWGAPLRFEGEINTIYWEGAITMALDGQTIYFASDRPGGYGGRDLYSANLVGFNSWGNVKNLGPEVNTKFDEDAPYIMSEGKTLYFSSNGPKSMGGNDIFFTKNQGGKWSESINAGIPINTIYNEQFYSISADGQTGYFSRTTDHNGSDDQDIYDVNPGMIGEKPVLALISGKVFLDNKNESASIILRDLETGKIMGKFETNPNTGLFSMLVSPDKKYSIDVMMGKEKQYTDTLNTEFIKEFIKLQHNYHVYSDDYHGEIPVLQLSLQKHVEQVYNKETGKVEEKQVVELANAFASIKNDTLKLHKEYKQTVGENRINFYKNNPEIAAKEGVTHEVLKEAHDIVKNHDHEVNDDDHHHVVKAKDLLNPKFSSDEVVYRVQVAAYRKPQNYHWDNKDSFGDVLEKTYPDGITRFTIGGTKHLSEAKELQKRLVQKGIKDAFVVAYKGNTRVATH